MSDPTNPTAYDDDSGCILCRCDKHTSDPVKRGFMYAACVGMAARANVPWLAFSNSCRNHQIGLNTGTGLVGDVLLEIVLHDASPEEAKVLRERMRRTRMLLTELEIATMERYEVRERELEGKGEGGQ